MKITICGKGGCGKSTVTALLARAMSKNGKQVMVVDVDESNIGLYRMLGIEMPTPLMAYFGGKKEFAEQTRPAGVQLGMDSTPALFPQKMTMGDLPEKCLGIRDGIYAISVGKIEHSGEGCACPMGKLFRMLFSSLQVQKDDVVIVDTAAGVEHFGRSLDSQCDHVLCVVDPSYESIVMAHKVSTFGKQMKLPVSFVLNKVALEHKAHLVDQLKGLDMIGCIPNEPSIFLDTLKGEAIQWYPLEIEKICDALDR
jgi:CO dehydrogenase maturation factor